MKEDSEDLKRIKAYLDEIGIVAKRTMSDSLELSCKIIDFVNAQEVETITAVIGLCMAYAISSKQFYNDDVIIEGLKNMLYYLDAMEKDDGNVAKD